MDSARHESFMRRCFHLAKMGQGLSKTNPLVGAVVTYEDRIIGEGYHEKYGEAHAEVAALESIAEEDRPLLGKSTLYVSLEPCNHFGKTPPCTNLIIENNIPRVVVSCYDPNNRMSGRSIEMLREQGVVVLTGILQDEGKKLLKPFTVNHVERIPYIVLKWAESADRYIGVSGKRVPISNTLSQHFVHKWRSELDAIVVGTDTAIIDNPLLNVRAYPGRNPQRVVIDRTGRIPLSHHLLSDDDSTWIFTNLLDYPNVRSAKKVIHVKQDLRENLQQVFEYLLDQGIGTVLVEGGSELFKSLIKAQLWHEARIIRSQSNLGGGIPAPRIQGAIVEKSNIMTDKILIINKLNDKNG